MSDRMLSDEILLGIINSKSGGGGGGGTDDYNDLSNQPQINGNTLIGNKTASDLGLVAAETGKGLSANDYTDEDKAIVGGVTAALAGKQGALTAGDHIEIDDDTISVNRWAVPAGKVVYTVITSDENYGQNVHVQRHTLGGTLIDDRTFLCEMYKTVNVDNLISIYNPYASFNITLLKDSDEHQAGYSYTVSPISKPTSNSFTFVMPQEENDNDLIIRSELDAVSDAVDAIKDGTNIDSFADVETALALKQDKTDNSLQTTDKTVVGAINEHEGDINSLKSGLTNVQDDVKLNTNDLTTPSRTKNVLPMTLSSMKSINSVGGTWNNNVYTINGVDFTVNEDADGNVVNITVNGTASDVIYFYLANNLSYLGTFDGSYKVNGGADGGSAEKYALQVYSSFSSVFINCYGSNDYIIEKTGYTTSDITSAIIVVRSGAIVNNIVFTPMIRLATETSATFAPYIPSVESRIEAVESGINLTANVTVGDHVTIDTTTAYIIKVGCIVVCMLSLTATQDLSANDEILLTNMPIPSKTRLVPISCGSKQFQCSVNTSGVFKFSYSNNTLQSGETAKMLFTYPL